MSEAERFHQTVKNLLYEDLGTLSPGEIADRLRHAGIKGAMKAGDRCPLGKYLGRKLRAPLKIDDSVLWVRMPTEPLNFVMKLPYSVRLFQKYFFAGSYPDLVGDE